MAIARLWWADDTDVALTEGRLKALKQGQLSNFKWLNWTEEETSELSFKSLYREITSGTMFEDGKVIIVRGLPSCHAELAPCLKQIPQGIILVIIGGMAKNLKLYKAAKELEKQNLAKIDEGFKLDKSNAKQWIKDRAVLYGGSIDDMGAKILFDLVGPKPNLIDRELFKMVQMTENGHITPFIAQDACFYEGDADVFRMCSAIIQGNRMVAHEFLQRLLNKGENPFKICGYLMDWSRKIVIAESYGRNYDSVDKAKIESLQKPDREDDSPASISLEQFNRKEVLKTQKLIPNIGALYYICKELSESPKQAGWGFYLFPLIMRLMIELRKGSPPEHIFHEFVEKAVSGENLEYIEENEDAASSD